MNSPDNAHTDVGLICRGLHVIVICESMASDLQIAQDVMRAGYVVHSCRKAEVSWGGEGTTPSLHVSPLNHI